MSLSLVVICLAAVVGLYSYNNPRKHGSWFMTRRFINWFPLGMAYAPSHGPLQPGRLKDGAESGIEVAVK